MILQIIKSIREEKISFEDALYESGFEWDYENPKKPKEKKYKIYLNSSETREEFIATMKRMGTIIFQGEQINCGKGYVLAQDILK